MLIRRKGTDALAGITSALVACLIALTLATCGIRAPAASIGEGASTRAEVSTTDSSGDGGSHDVTTTPAELPFDYGAVAGEGNGLEPIELNGGVPFFSEEELTLDAREEYAPLDALGRCGQATLLAGPETVPTTPRPDIGSIIPSGWVQARYSFIAQSNGALYNRSHLVARSLGGADVAENLITGTTHLNQDLMERYEGMARGQVRAGRHVLWRVTPVFEADELVAHGVLIEGCTIEDSGGGLSVCVWCPNAQPGVEIDYATGESHAAEKATVAGETDGDANATSRHYVLNTKSMVYHLPDKPCSNAISERNRAESGEDAVALEAQGYRPCGSCHPDRAA